MDQLAEQMSSRLFGEWQAFYRLEPRGEARADWRSALQTAFLYNIQVGKKDQQKPEKFLLEFEAPREEEDPAEHWKTMLATVEMLNAAFGGDDLRAKKTETPNEYDCKTDGEPGPELEGFRHRAD